MPDEEAHPPIEFEDMMINRKKYRVPEKIIRLDFWDKLGLGKGSVMKFVMSRVELTGPGNESPLRKAVTRSSGNDRDQCQV